MYRKHTSAYNHREMIVLRFNGYTDRWIGRENRTQRRTNRVRIVSWSRCRRARKVKNIWRTWPVSHHLPWGLPWRRRRLERLRRPFCEKTRCFSRENFRHVGTRGRSKISPGRREKRHRRNGRDAWTADKNVRRPNTLKGIAQKKNKIV